MSKRQPDRWFLAKSYAKDEMLSFEFTRFFFIPEAQQDISREAEIQNLANALQFVEELIFYTEDLRPYSLVPLKSKLMVT